MIVVSVSLYGDKPEYIIGARDVLRVLKEFSQVQLHIYHDDTVPRAAIEALTQEGAIMQDMTPFNHIYRGELRAFWRFLPCTSYPCVLVTDTDSTIDQFRQDLALTLPLLRNKMKTGVAELWGWPTEYKTYGKQHVSFSGSWFASINLDKLKDLDDIVDQIESYLATYAAPLKYRFPKDKRLKDRFENMYGHDEVFLHRFAQAALRAGANVEFWDDGSILNREEKDRREWQLSAIGLCRSRRVCRKR